MGAETEIAWCDSTWNPVRGCSRVSAGCDHCYAMGQAHRFSGPGKPFEGLTTIRKGKVDWAGVARFVPEMLDAPLRWKKPRRIFVNSMSDLFHESLSNEEIAAVFGVMAACPQHTFQILTKRAERMRLWFKWVTDAAQARLACSAAKGITNKELTERDLCVQQARAIDALEKKHLGKAYAGSWPLQNVWLGVSVEDQKTADDRLSELLCIPATVRFASYEPALGPVDFWAFLKSEIRDKALTALKSSHVPGLDWVIVGGESGAGARPFNLDWASSVVDRCEAAKVCCFVKQLGARPCITQAAWRKLSHGVVPLLSPRSEHASVREAGLVQLALRHKKGGEMSEWPEPLRVRQFPGSTSEGVCS